MATATTNFDNITSGFYGIEQGKELNSYQDYLASVSEELQKNKDADAKEAQKIIQDKNAGISQQYEKYKLDINKAKSDQEKRIAQIRGAAQGIVKEQEAAAGLEAQIQGAKAPSNMAKSQLAKISGDISNAFNTSLAESKNNLNTFEQGLNDKLSTLDFDTIDKQQMLTGLKKVLSDEESQPALDAIASKAQTREEFLKIFSAFYSGLKEDQVGKLTSKGEEEQRYIYDEKFWNSLDNKGKEDYLTRNLGNIINFTQAQLQTFLAAAKQSNNPQAIFAFMNKIKAMDDQEKQAYLISVNSEGTAAKHYADTEGFFKDPNKKFDVDTTNKGAGADDSLKGYNDQKIINSIANGGKNNYQQKPETKIDSTSGATTGTTTDNTIIKKDIGIPIDKSLPPINTGNITPGKTVAPVTKETIGSTVINLNKKYSPIAGKEQLFLKDMKLFEASFGKYKDSDPAKYISYYQKLLDGLVTKGLIIKK